MECGMRDLEINISSSNQTVNVDYTPGLPHLAGYSRLSLSLTFCFETSLMVGV
jgi:hypothetical protein